MIKYETAYLTYKTESTRHKEIILKANYVIAAALHLANDLKLQSINAI